MPGFLGMLIGVFAGMVGGTDYVTMVTVLFERGPLTPVGGDRVQ